VWGGGLVGGGGGGEGEIGGGGVVGGGGGCGFFVWGGWLGGCGFLGPETKKNGLKTGVDHSGKIKTKMPWHADILAERGNLLNTA